MKVIIFDGSPEEYLRVAETLQNPKTTVQTSSAQSTSVKDKVGPRSVDKEEAVEILTRRPLSDNIKNVLRALYQAHDRSLTSEDLRNVNSHNSDEFRGMMGAFGRRVVNTVGANISFFEREWDFQAYQYRWSLSEAARHGIEEAGVLD